MRFFILLSIFLQLYFIHARSLLLPEDKALLGIKSAITHDPHNCLSSWNSTTHHCTWLGVTCSSAPNRHVISLDISACRLTGTLSPDIGFLGNLQYLSAAENKLSGEIPKSLSQLNNLIEMVLYGNGLRGSIPEGIGDLPKLERLALSMNNLSGSVPRKLGTNGKLQCLDLSGNNLTGDLPQSLGSCQSLMVIYMNENMLSGSIPKGLFGLPYLGEVNLSENLLRGGFPETRDSVSENMLMGIDLSNNELSGTLPPTIGNFSNLVELHLKGNRFSGSIPPQIGNLQQLILIDLSSNNFSGEIPELPGVRILLPGAFPVLPNGLRGFFASNNSLSGPIDLSICNSSLLLSLDLSNNMLFGQIPSCLPSSLKYLRMLNLGSNDLVGSIPANFSKCDSLQDLDLSYNQLEGIVPRSLAQCNDLEVLNLGNNKLNDTFPHWLGTLPNLQVLVLRFNYFHGELIRSYSEQLFSKLRILDLSNNHFNGTLPSKLIKDMQAMRRVNESETKSQQYLSYEGIGGEYYSVTITVKGFDRYVRILNTIATIDVASNMFTGDIPTSIGVLEALRWLNLSHNNFANQIPPTIGNLKVLESFDLSCNNLSGEIPLEIENLTFLEWFNVYQNQLVGLIPQSTQLSTFNNDSYLENPGLCGPPLSKKCRNEDAPQQLPPTPDDPLNTDWASDIHLWEVILIGCAFGWVVGVISGYFILSAREPLWLSRFVWQLEYRVLQRLKMRGRHHQMRATRN